MKHRDRVRAALNHEQPDRCPMQVSFTPEFAERLKRDMDIRGIQNHNPHGGGNTYQLEIALDEDMLLTSVGWANSYYKESADYVDEWGIGFGLKEYETKFGKGTYTEIVKHPLSDESAIDSYTPPDPSRPELYAESERVVKTFGDEYWIVGVTVTTIFETAWALRGLDTLLMDFALAPEIAHRVLDIPFRYHLTAAKKLVALGVDMMWIGDDVGTQNGMLISPDTWRTFLKPRLAEFISELKTLNPAVKVAYHSDGAIYPIIPELIEIGLDVLNPVQPACMDPEALKREYGKKLCFWGSIDEQYTLPFGSPSEVKTEVLKRLRTIGKNGGLIIGPTHHVQPLENFWTMIDTIKETQYSAL